MKKKILSLISVLIFLLTTLCGCSMKNNNNVEIEDINYDCNSKYLDRVNFGAKFEPKGNYILHGAGQDQSGLTVTFDNYVNTMGEGLTPCVSMGYVAPHHHYIDWSEYMKKSLSIYNPEEQYIMLQIGVHFNKDENPDECYYDKIADGSMDTELKMFIRILKSFEVPIYCRPGFEFNGEWNGYTNANTFVKAFRRFHDLVEECEADNICLLWCMNPDAKEKNFMKYYPGDEYVDWFAIDIFRADSCYDKVTKDFLAKANERKKPVMITESTPFTYDVTKGEGWDEWFTKYFNFIRSNPVIKGFCYINWYWRDYPQWINWGDARLEAATNGIAEKYKEELSDPIFMHAKSKAQTKNAIYGFAE